MRSRPFIPAGEQPRPFSEVMDERRALDPIERSRELVRGEIARLEAEAKASVHPAERKLLQCQAEGLRAALDEGRTR